MADIRSNWTRDEVKALYDKPLLDLLYDAQTTHRKYFPEGDIQAATLFNIKTGGCPEDCNYCSQSAHYKTPLKREKLCSVDEVMTVAKRAKANGATRFCLGAAWRSPPKKDLPNVLKMIEGINALGMESCVTLGMLDEAQAEQLKAVGLDYYNHNLDTSENYYDKVVTTRTFQDRLNTLKNARKKGIKLCTGGILGLGESGQDRADLLIQLAAIEPHPESVPINKLVPIPGTPFAEKDSVDFVEFLKTIAVARILMPKSYVRLSAGRESMSDEMQALCFMAGANSIFYGESLLTQPNAKLNQDNQLLTRLGLKIEPSKKAMHESAGA